jgi:hypothetical protein
VNLSLADTVAPMLDWLPPVLMLVGVIVLGVIVALLMRSNRNESTCKTDSHAAENAMIAQAETIRQQLEDIRKRVGELIGTAQRLASRIDDKAERLQELLMLVDQRLEIFEQSETALDIATRATSAVDHRGTIEEAETSDPQEAPTRHVDVESKPASAALGDGSSVDATTRSIYELADAGRGSLEIARELQEQVGKVELILALRDM